MNVALLPSDKRTLVNIWVSLDVGIVRELELIPLGVVEWHCDFAGIELVKRKMRTW